ncbi:MAG: META domain-containing protein [Pseudodesulfovibrio sp.]|nr:META domain-containing protein [Pseudodesulfovibrio sp.]
MLKRWKCDCFVLSLLAVSLFLFAGCGTHEVAPMNTDSVKKELIGKVWNVKSLFSRDVNSDQSLTLEFMEDGTVKGFGGCNNFSGPYTLDGENLTFGPMVSTKKSCGPATDEQEYTFLTFLAVIQNVKISENEVLLISSQQPKPMVLTTGEGGFLW